MLIENATEMLFTNMSNSSGQLTVLLPWTEVELGDLGAVGVAVPSGPVLEGVVWELGDACVVTNDPSQRGFPQRCLLLLGEDTVVLPPQSERDKFPSYSKMGSKKVIVFLTWIFFLFQKDL